MRIDQAVEFLRARARELRVGANVPGDSEGKKNALKTAEELGRCANEIERRANRNREDGHGEPEEEA